MLMKIVSSNETISYFNDAYNNMTIRYGDMKKQLAEDINNYIAPIREKIVELINDEHYLKKIISRGSEVARESAAETINGVRQLMGINYF